jgi:hypothetical protein
MNNGQMYGLWADTGSYSADDPGYSYGRYIGYAGNHSHTITGGDSETRPVNISVNYIIKIN